MQVVTVSYSNTQQQQQQQQQQQLPITERYSSTHTIRPDEHSSFRSTRILTLDDDHIGQNM
jgi:hypothetical protein